MKRSTANAVAVAGAGAIVVLALAAPLTPQYRVQYMRATASEPQPIATTIYLTVTSFPDGYLPPATPLPAYPPSKAERVLPQPVYRYYLPEVLNGK